MRHALGLFGGINDGLQLGADFTGGAGFRSRSLARIVIFRRGVQATIYGFLFRADQRGKERLVLKELLGFERDALLIFGRHDGFTTKGETRLRPFGLRQSFR